jgi:molybdopterin-guanine dinucleotide biosynthesis protein A
MERILTCNNRPLGLIILAGGRSRRMRRNKALLAVPGGVLIETILRQLRERFAQVIVSVSNRKDFNFLSNVDLVPDPVPDQGPMYGIYHAMGVSCYDKNFVIACDIPVIDMELLQRLITAAESVDIAVPENGDHLLEPLFAVYSQSVRPVMKELLERGERSLLPLFKSCRVKKVPLKGEPLVNLNTLEDYERFLNTVKPVNGEW